MNTEILSVGTELLLGNTANTDAKDLSEKLALLGINVFWHTVVGDNPSRLKECIAIARHRADLIITTGGLGPTCDDLTKQTLAEAFGLKLELNREEERILRQHFASRGSRAFTPNQLQQAYLPEGCTVFHNEWGTAPGCAFQAEGTIVIMLPGPPGECNPMFEHCAMPYLRSLSSETIRSHQLRMIGIGEGAMESILRDKMNSYTNPTLAPYAKPGECLVRVTAKAGSDTECEELMVPVIEDVKSLLGEYIYGIDTPSLEWCVHELLKKKKLTLCSAEGDSRGGLAKRLNDIPGGCNCFLGGVFVPGEKACRTLLHIEHFDATPDCAAAMAGAVRNTLDSDLAIGISPAEKDEKFITVYVALATGEDMFVSKVTTPNRRTEYGRLQAVNRALDMLRRYLTGLSMV